MADEHNRIFRSLPLESLTLPGMRLARSMLSTPAHISINACSYLNHMSRLHLVPITKWLSAHDLYAVA